MKLTDFYSEIADIKGEPQIIDGLPIWPIKLFDTEQTSLLYLLFVKDKAELIDDTFMPFVGVQKSYKASYLKALLYQLKSQFLYD